MWIFIQYECLESETFKSVPPEVKYGQMWQKFHDIVCFLISGKRPPEAKVFGAIFQCIFIFRFKCCSEFSREQS